MSKKSMLRPTIALLRRRMADDKGATAIEYALVASGIGAAISATVWNFGSTLRGFYDSVAALFG